MRLNINAGGLDGFFNGVCSFLSGEVNEANSNHLINSLSNIVNKTNNLNGGVGTLSIGLDYVQTRKAAEESRKIAMENVKSKTDSFIQMALRVDAEVATMVSSSREAFYQTNPWLRPQTPSSNLEKILEKIWDTAGDTVSMCWNGIKEFYRSNNGNKNEEFSMKEETVLIELEERYGKENANIIHELVNTLNPKEKKGLWEYIKQILVQGAANLKADYNWILKNVLDKIGEIIASVDDSSKTWISDEPIQLIDLEGNNILADKLIKIGVTQEKVNAIWDGCNVIYDTYGIQVDPVLLLSILGQEGNGSFNTDPNNKAADGQNGYEKDFAIDLIRANDFMFGKVIGYIVYGEEFSSVVCENTSSAGISGNGNFAQYANWNTPAISLKKGYVYTGVYAGHGNWHVGVTSFYESIQGEGAMDTYSSYLENIEADELDELLSIIDLPKYTFDALQNAQTWDGDKNGEYTVSVQ